MSSEHVCLSVILLIIILIILFFALFYHNRLAVCRPLCAPAAEVRKILGEIVDLGNEVNRVCDNGNIIANSVKNNINLMLGNLNNLCVNSFGFKDHLSPECINALYRGFASSNHHAAADAYILAGQYFEDSEFGDILTMLGYKLYQLQRAIHKLGASLDFE